MSSEQVGSSPEGTHDFVVSGDAGSAKLKNSTPTNEEIQYTINLIP